MAALAIVLSHIRRSLQWLWFAEDLRERGIDHLFILIDPQRPPLADELEHAGSRVYYLAHRSTASHVPNAFACRQLMRRHDVRVVHSELPYGNLLGQVAARASGVANRVSTCENASWAQDYGSRKQAAIDRLTYRLSRKVIVLTRRSKRYLAETYGVPEGKLAVIPHALRAAPFENIPAERIAGVRRQMGIGAGEFIVGMVARMERWKGHRFAIEAMQRVRTERPDVRLVILGLGGESEEAVRRQIAESGLGDVVRLAGFVDDTIAAYRAFDVHLHVPINDLVETGGITILEGMMSGCAQVLTLSGFALDSARHMQNAWVVDYQSSDAIAEALLRLRDDADLRKSLGDAARDEALKSFEFRSKVDRHLEIYGIESLPQSGP